jgi:hypothetical protein
VLNIWVEPRIKKTSESIQFWIFPLQSLAGIGEFLAVSVNDRRHRPSGHNQGTSAHLQHLLLCPRIAGNLSSEPHRRCSAAG